MCRMWSPAPSSTLISPLLQTNWNLFHVVHPGIPQADVRMTEYMYRTSTSVSDPDLDSIRSVDPDPGGQKWPKKIRQSWENSCFEVLDVFFERWRLLLWLGCLCGLLAISKCNFWSKKYLQKNSSPVNFFQFLLIKTLDPGSVFSLKCWIRNQWIRIQNTYRF